MPKEKEQTQADTFIDEGTGLVLRRDPFGGEGHDVVDVFDPTDWDILEEDFGEIIDWAVTPTIAGIIRNQKMVMIDRDDERGEQPSNLYSIELINGERRAFYGNYQLDQALGCPHPGEGRTPYMGRLVLIRWMGKREQGKGGRTLNVYTVAVKKEVVDTEPF